MGIAGKEMQRRMETYRGIGTGGANVVRKFKIIGVAIFLIALSGCGGSGSSSSGGGTAPSGLQNVTTIAGTAGVNGSADGVGAAAQFNFPTGITSDGTNLYVTDFSNHTVRKIVIATGEVSTIAGTAGASGSADGTGPEARFNNPYGIATDGTNLYVTDSHNNTIRKIVIATGEVSTIAGTAGTTGNANGTGPAAAFSSPEGITTDKTNTNLYVTDSNNNTIRKIEIATKIVSTIAGSGAAGSIDATGTAAVFNLPQGITTDGTNLYVADTANSTIRQIVIATAAVTTIAGYPGQVGWLNDFGANARFDYPIGITTDGTNLYVADTAGSWIRQVNIATTYVTGVAGGPAVQGSTDGSVSVALFNNPYGITAVGADLYVADTFNGTIRKIY
jgi:DNA-binding beta-propeller fold protein YncE